MANITISIDEKLLRESREYAKVHGTTLNGLIRKLLQHSVTSTSDAWLEECFTLMDKAQGNSRGKRWTREELYDR